MRTVLWTGSRGWRDEDTVIDCVTSLRHPFLSIVGDADGWDSIVWDVLSVFSLPRMRFKAQWKTHGKRAGHVRNELMGITLMQYDKHGFVVAGWDGKSRGTKGMIDFAAKCGIPVWRAMYVPSLNEGS